DGRAEHAPIVPAWIGLARRLRLPESADRHRAVLGDRDVLAADSAALRKREDEVGVASDHERADGAVGVVRSPEVEEPGLARLKNGGEKPAEVQTATKKKSRIKAESLHHKKET